MFLICIILYIQKNKLHIIREEKRKHENKYKNKKREINKKLCIHYLFGSCAVTYEHFEDFLLMLCIYFTVNQFFTQHIS